MPSFKALLPGDPAPWFRQRTSNNPRYAFDVAAGRYIVLCFYASAGDVPGREAIAAAQTYDRFFNDEFASFFGVSLDPADQAQRRVADRFPGYRFFWDFDGEISRLYGAIPVDAHPNVDKVPLRRMWFVLDPTLRILKVIPFSADGSDGRELGAYLGSLPPPSRYAGMEVQAPVLVLPHVFEPELCDKLIALYESHGGETSGFMREVDGKTVLTHDPDHKRRKDYIVADNDIIRTVQTCFNRRVLPEIKKAYQFKVTHMERYIVSCYSAEDGGHFRAHRDNTTSGTAHRRFAVSVNLNADYDGGELSFPEYGPKSFKPAPGGAVVFSCSLLHAASQVTRGKRYAFLPFLYDDEAAKVREANAKYIQHDAVASK
jgi:peroxiredoxin/predicted 2-oxoglutarate/Fe(II)-dependent dioxygenase YbiX